MSEPKIMYEFNKYRGAYYINNLRNQRKFNIGDEVFFSTCRYRERVLLRGVICSVRLSYDEDEENPEYVYCAKINEDYSLNGCIERREGHVVGEFDCDAIFWTIEEAEQSARDSENRRHELQLQEIGEFFEWCRKEDSRVLARGDMNDEKDKPTPRKENGRTV